MHIRNGEGRLTGLSDEALMKLYQKDDYGAFEELYGRYSKRVYGYLMRRNVGKSADDILQNIFLRVHRYRHRFDCNLPFQPWLFSVVRTTLIDHFRKRMPEIPGNEQLDTTIAETAAERESGSDWEGILASLEPEQRTLIELRFAQGWTYEQIGEHLGVTQVSARKRLSRIISSLRMRLRERGGT